MRWNPNTCPRCGGPARYFLHVLLAQASLVLEDQEYDFDSEDAEILWDSMAAVEDAEGKHSLRCEKGHQWQGEPLYGEADAPGQPGDLMGELDEAIRRAMPA